MKCWKASAFSYSILAVHKEQFPWAKSIPQFVILATGLFCGLGLSQNFFGCSIRAPFTTCLTETESVAGPSRCSGAELGWAGLKVIPLT